MVLLSGCGSSKKTGKTDDGYTPVITSDVPVHKNDTETENTPIIIDSKNPLPSDKEDEKAPRKQVSIYDKLKGKDSFNIAVILPLNLDQTPYSETAKKYFNFDAPTKMALDFYEGFYIAAQKLQGLGLKANFNIIDDKNSEWVIDTLIKQWPDNKYDLIIGPIYNKNLRIVSKYALDKQIPIFSPLSASSSITNNNPYYFSANATNESVYENIINVISKRFPKEEVWVINNGTDEEKEIIKTLTKKANEKGQHVDLHEFNLDKSWDTTKIPYFFDDTLQKIIIVPSFNEEFVTYTLNRLKQLPTHNPLHIYGMVNWPNFKKSVFDGLKNQEIFVTASTVTNPSEASVFNSLYDLNFEKKPGDASYIAYDLVMYIGTQLINKNFSLLTTQPFAESSHFTKTQFNFRPLKNEKGDINYYDNAFVYFLKYEAGSGFKKCNP